MIRPRQTIEGTIHNREVLRHLVKPKHAATNSSTTRDIQSIDVSKPIKSSGATDDAYRHKRKQKTPTTAIA
jgi:hypothetical protein